MRQYKTLSLFLLPRRISRMEEIGRSVNNRSIIGKSCEIWNGEFFILLQE